MTPSTIAHNHTELPEHSSDASRSHRQHDNSDAQPTKSFRFAEDTKPEAQWRESDSTHQGDEPDIEKSAHDATRSMSASKRPDLITRQTTTASYAAAPYAGPYLDGVPSRSTNDEKGHGQARPRSSSTSSGASTLNELPTNLTTASRVSTDQYGNSYPEGGKEAYLCVLGSLCGLMGALGKLSHTHSTLPFLTATGLMNTVGTFQAYLSTHQLADQTEMAIGWIFGIYAFLSFFCGIQIGPIFDAKGPRWLVLAGSILILACWLLIGVCKKYYQFLIVFGIVGYPILTQSHN